MKKLIKHKKGLLENYDSNLFKDIIYFAEDKKKIIVNGIEYGLDLESDEVDLISNIDYEDNKLTITFSNGKTKEIELEIELEDHRAYWEELPSLEESFPMGGCVIRTHPIKEFTFKGSLNNGKWYSSDGQEGLYTASDTTITFKEEGEYTLKFVNGSFDGNNGLEEITDNSVKSVLMIGGSNGKTKGIKPVNKNENAKLILYNNITSIEYRAFEGCSGFTGDLIIPESVTSIGYRAFEDCSGFTGKLILPDGLTSIEYGAFGGCLGFTGKLILPDGLTSIGDGAFYNCEGFTGELKLPESLTNIGYTAFTDCTSLSKIYVCEDTKLGRDWNSNTTAEVIKYKKGEKPWL